MIINFTGIANGTYGATTLVQIAFICLLIRHAF